MRYWDLLETSDWWLNVFFSFKYYRTGLRLSLYFFCLFRKRSLLSLNALRCWLSLIYCVVGCLWYDVIEVKFRLAMIWISVAGIILWTYLLTFVVETTVFNVFFLLKLSFWIMFFAIRSHLWSSAKFHVLNWVICWETHFFWVGCRLVDNE